MNFVAFSSAPGFCTVEKGRKSPSPEDTALWKIGADKSGMTPVTAQESAMWQGRAN